MRKSPKAKNKAVKNQKEEVDLKKIISPYLRQWKWFVISLIVFIGMAFLNLRYTTPQYNAYAKIMLVDDSGISNPADEILKDLGKYSSSDSKKVEDEIEILKSRKLMTGVVKRLELNKQFFVKGRLHNTQFFPNQRAPIKINFISPDSLVYKSSFSFNILVTSETSFDFIFKPIPEGEEISKKMFFGKRIDTPLGDIIITPNNENISNLINQTIYVEVKTLDKVAENYKNAIAIKQVKEFSKVIDLQLKDPSADKAKAIINTLIDEYNRRSIEEKSTKSSNTAEFINKRINLIATDLSKVDDEIEEFKTGNKLTNITSEADLYLKSGSQTEQNLAISRTEYNMVNYMKNQISDDSFVRIPSNIGLSDGSINSMASRYNELLNDRDRLLKSSNLKNPIIVNLDQQLNNLKNGLRQSLNNSAKTIGLQIRSFENQAAKLNSKIYAVPGQVRKSRDIEREQGIKESLYLFLLQKREEATISLIATSPNAKIIDSAHAKNSAVSPNKPIIYLAFLILGLCVPFAIFYVKELLDTKIHNKEDLEKTIKNITILGEIPRISGSDKSLIERNDRSVLSESFRIIRTNLDYVKRGREVDNYDNVIFVTSTINSEGKSFFSMNMALTLANTDKRVLLIGADIRNPQIFSVINNQKKKEANKIGLTEYLVDKSTLVREAINTYEINNNKIDILLSGKVPPNPAELLMSDRMKTLFDKVSNQYDYVIVDTAPAMLVTDTLLFSQYAGHTIYLTRAGYTEKRILNFAKELHTDKKLNGMMLVVNDVKQSNFGYGAKYGYYGAKEKKSFFRRKA